MKKTLLVLFMMVALMGSVFAMEAVVQGDAIATFGYDLENGNWGFENSLDDFGVYFTFIDEASAYDNATDDDMYGSIEISDISMALWSTGKAAPYDNDDDSLTGTISAKIHKGNLFMGIYNAPDVDTNYAENFGYSSVGADVAAAAAAVVAADKAVVDVTGGSASAVAAAAAAKTAADAALVKAIAAAALHGPSNSSDYNNDILYLGATGGMSFGYDDGTNVVTLSVSSVGDWDADQSVPVSAATASFSTIAATAKAAGKAGALNTEGKFVMGLTSDLSFGDFSLEAAMLYANKYWVDSTDATKFVAYTGFGMSPSYEMTLSDSMSVEAAVGVDVVMLPKDVVGVAADADGTYYDVAPSVTVNLAPENADEDRTNLMVGVYMSGSTAKAEEIYNMALNAQVVFTEEHDGGFVDGMGASLSVALLDLMDFDKDMTKSAMTYAVDVEVDYDVMPGLTPSAGFGMGTNDGKTNLALGLEMGSDFTGIANTTFNMDYASSSIVSADATDTLAAVDDLGGVFTFATTISW